MLDKIRIGTRPSKLALKQVEEVQRMIPSVRFETILIKTIGDKDKLTPFSSMEGSDFFTREIEEVLLKGRIDAAVHSAKDLEGKIPEGLTIAAITRSISPYECLVSRGNKRLDQFPKGSVIATSSQKRRVSLLKYRNDLHVCDVRGTIEERLYQLDNGRFEGLIVAYAALIRLGLEDRIAEIISPEIIEPHPLQGSLAIEVRFNDLGMINLFKRLNTHKVLQRLQCSYSSHCLTALQDQICFANLEDNDED